MGHSLVSSCRPENSDGPTFGWGAVTVLLVGALLTIIGIVIIFYAFFGFIIGRSARRSEEAACSASLARSWRDHLFVIGGLLAASVDGSSVSWWIFLLGNRGGEHRQTRPGSARRRRRI